MVYFIKAETYGAIKVGSSVDPIKRLTELQVSSPDDLELLGVVSGGINIEKRFHRLFRKQHLRGEWYKIEGTCSKILKRLRLEKPKKEYPKDFSNKELKYVWENELNQISKSRNDRIKIQKFIGD
jgi:hypothetical protein